jgi:hypothetical protein
MLSVIMIRNLKVGLLRWSSLQWHYVYTKFQESPSIGEKVLRKINIHKHDDTIALYFIDCSAVLSGDGLHKWDSELQ